MCFFFYFSVWRDDGGPAQRAALFVFTASLDEMDGEREQDAEGFYGKCGFDLEQQKTCCVLQRGPAGSHSFRIKPLGCDQ